MPDGKKIKFTASYGGKWHGSIWVHDGGPFASRRTYLRIGANCELEWRPNVPQDIRAKINQILEAPREQMILNGKEYSNCCFCGKELTTQESLFAGYGPICADNWNLPWGETAEGQITSLGNMDDMPC
jgi:hypothetical protein